LRAVFSDVVHGDLPAYREWLTPVYEK